MEELVVNLLKQSPIVGFLLGLAFIAARWMQTMQLACHDRHKELMVRYEEQAEKLLALLEKALERELNRER